MSVIIPGVVALPLYIEDSTKFSVESTGSQSLRVQISGTDSSAVIDWGDGNAETIGIGTVSHTYSSPGAYNGSVTRNLLGNRDLRLYGNALKAVSKIQNGLWSLRLSHDVSTSPNLTNVPVEIPSSISDLSRCFWGCFALQDTNLSGWDVSNVTNMESMFYLSSFNQDIGSWDVSNVTNMFAMLAAGSFNQDIGSWDVSNVINMGFMFYSNTDFNQDLSSWCVSNFPSEPSNFSTGATAWVLPKPIWGTCPGA